MLSIRGQYEKSNVKDYYLNNNENYNNPHLDYIHESLDHINKIINIGYFLDLACGNGEVSLYLQDKGLILYDGIDPYFTNVYTSNTKHTCLNNTFEDIAKCGLPKKYDTIICSYAMHLCSTSYLSLLLYNLAISCKHLVIITPNNKPIIGNEYFSLLDKNKFNKSKVLIYKSNFEN